MTHPPLALPPPGTLAAGSTFGAEQVLGVQGLASVRPAPGVPQPPTS
jgi:hypothetical protein